MLNSAQINALPPRDREQYAELERMFSSKGWKIFVVLAKERVAQGIQRAAFANTWEQNRAAIGYAQAYTEMGNLEEATIAEYEQKANVKLTATSLADELANE